MLGRHLHDRCDPMILHHITWCSMLLDVNRERSAQRLPHAIPENVSEKRSFTHATVPWSTLRTAHRRERNEDQRAKTEVHIWFHNQCVSLACSAHRESGYSPQEANACPSQYSSKCSAPLDDTYRHDRAWCSKAERQKNAHKVFPSKNPCRARNTILLLQEHLPLGCAGHCGLPYALSFKS